VPGGSRKRCWRRTAAPLNLSTNYIDNLIWQAGNILVAEIDGDARLLLLQFSRCRLGSCADVAEGMLESRFCEPNYLSVRDGLGRVVAHYCGREQKRPGGAVAEGVADMLHAGGARTGRE
jgi:hypothetical protein